MPSDQPASRTLRPAESGGLRIIALIAVGTGVAVLAAAAFVLSYPGIHAVARQAGVAAPFARIYPPALDAMLVVAGSAVLALRGAGLPSRIYAWLTLLILIAGLAAAGVAHATAAGLAGRDASAAAAIIPWLLLLASFGLLITMLRHARLRRTIAAGTVAVSAPETKTPMIAPHGVARAHYREIPVTEPPAGAPAAATAAAAPPASPPAAASTRAGSAPRADTQPVAAMPRSAMPRSAMPRSAMPGTAMPDIAMPGSTAQAPAGKHSGAMPGKAMPENEGQIPAARHGSDPHEPVTNPGPLPGRKWQLGDAAFGRETASGPGPRAAPGPDDPDDPTSDEANVPASWRIVGRARPRPAEPDPPDHEAPDHQPPDHQPPGQLSPAPVPPPAAEPAFDRMRSSPIPPADA